jgi:hypothetical protein
MRNLIATGILVLTTTSVYAVDPFLLPEPDTMFLMGVAAAGLLLALKKKEKKDKKDK